MQGTARCQAMYNYMCPTQHNVQRTETTAAPAAQLDSAKVSGSRAGEQLSVTHFR